MTIYIGVMALEFAPALFERLGWKVSLKRLNKVMFFVIALGAATDYAPVFNGVADDLGGLQSASAVAEL